jgi:uncharacterized membrane protein
VILGAVLVLLGVVAMVLGDADTLAHRRLVQWAGVVLVVIGVVLVVVDLLDTAWAT